MSGLPIACVTIPVPHEVQEMLRADCQPLLVGAAGDGVHAALAEAEGLFCSALFPVDAELLARAPRLRVVSNFGVGFNNVDLGEMTRRGIAVCNTPGVLTDAVADLTLALILAASRRMVENASYVSRGEWARREPPPALGFDLRGKTLGLVGFGRIGRAVALRAAAFGMDVAFHDVVEDGGPEYAQCRRLPLEALLRESDIVSLHTNLTAETHHLLGRDELALMKHSAWIVNTSRGPVIDQEALTLALRRGAIAGAALDVLEGEPPAPHEPLLALANVIVTPHIGSATVETRAAMMDLAARNLAAVLGGRRPPECVNPEALERALQRR